MITHYPKPTEPESCHTCADLERLLSSWFGEDVILTSSGRAAILLYLSMLGLNRYHDTISLPRMISACVMEVVVRRAFPVDIASGAQSSFTLTYHQYGLPQVWVPEAPALEDICHAFFLTANERRPLDHPYAAVFSLPKFFSTSGMCGGLIVRNIRLSSLLRSLRDQARVAPTDERRRLGVAFRKHYHGNCLAGSPLLEQLYASVLSLPAPFTGDLAGLPTTLSGIERVRARRADIANLIVRRLGQKWFPEGWADTIPKWLPFAIPAFCPDRNRLIEIDGVLSSHGIKAGVYQIDVRRDARYPDYCPALLLPCHHGIGEDVLSTMLDILISMTR